MEKVTKELIQSAPIIFILTTITVLTHHLANHDQQSVAHLGYIDGAAIQETCRVPNQHT